MRVRRRHHRARSSIAATATTYTTSSTGNWVGRWLAHRSEAADAVGHRDDRTTLFDAFVGRADHEPGARVRHRQSPTTAWFGSTDGSIARRYRVDVADRRPAPRPAALTFATLDAVRASPPSDLPRSIAFEVYVTDRPQPGAGHEPVRGRRASRSCSPSSSSGRRPTSASGCRRTGRSSRSPDRRRPARTPCSRPVLDRSL